VPYRPIEELAHQFRPSSVFLPEGMKTPDILVRVETQDGFLWWMGDQFSNSSVADQIWPLRFLARFVGSGLGYRCNSKPEMVYVRDRVAWIRSIREALEDYPPCDSGTRPRRPRDRGRRGPNAACARRCRRERGET
jgi:hypothetical protein